MICAQHKIYMQNNHDKIASTFLDDKQLYRIRARAKIERRYFAFISAHCSCIVTSHRTNRAYRLSGYMPQILSGFYRNLPLSDVTFHENVTAAICYYAAIRERRIVPAGNYRSHGIIIAIVIRSRGEAKKVRTRGDLPQCKTYNVDPPP